MCADVADSSPATAPEERQRPGTFLVPAFRMYSKRESQEGDDGIKISILYRRRHVQRKPI